MPTEPRPPSTPREWSPFPVPSSSPRGSNTVSTFTSADEAAAAVSTALQHNQQLLNDWVAAGAPRKIELDAPFTGGTVLERGAADAVTGTSVKVVLKGDGNGGWYVLTGFPRP
ncbi:RNase A-like domain-containing protein [Mycolicibacterium sp.]|uniref:RNase A-like domain-containing protein n=1 Tax=Mycolicibacterium sp. TaxID=2320850 RepID=UPI0037CA0F33